MDAEGQHRPEVLYVKGRTGLPEPNTTAAPPRTTGLLILILLVIMTYLLLPFWVRGSSRDNLVGLTLQHKNRDVLVQGPEIDIVRVRTRHLTAGGSR